MSKRRRKDCQQRFTSSEVAPVPDHHSQTGLLTPPLTELWENRETALAALEPAGTGAASFLTVGTAAYLMLTRERRELMREWVGPLHEALHRPLGPAERTDARRYLHVPKNFSDDAEIRIDLPRQLGFSREVVADLITQKLALEGVTFSWHPEGRMPYVRVKKTRKPPAKAVFEDPRTRELVARAKESAPIIARERTGRRRDPRTGGRRGRRERHLRLPDGRRPPRPGDVPHPVRDPGRPVRGDHRRGPAGPDTPPPTTRSPDPVTSAPTRTRATGHPPPGPPPVRRRERADRTSTGVNIAGFTSASEGKA